MVKCLDCWYNRPIIGKIKRSFEDIKPDGTKTSYFTRVRFRNDFPKGQVYQEGQEYCRFYDMFVFPDEERDCKMFKGDKRR